MEQNSEYLWLKQSVTFTVNGQTRTVEIALPVRPGATADEVEALLSEADAGMERLSRHLDARVAAIGGAPTPLITPATAPEPARAPVPPSPQAEPSAPATVPATRPAAEAASPPPPRTPTRPTPAPNTPPTSARPAAAAPAPTTSAPSRTPQAARGETQGELSRPEFIAALKDLDLDVRTAMQKLNVRSLEGLNLREALEALRRQSMRSGPVDAPVVTAPAKRTPAPAPGASRPTPIRDEPPHYFEEEDEPDMTFSVEDEDAEPEEEEPPYEDGAPNAWDDDGDELDDVPDFGPPPSSRRSAPATRPAPSPLPARPARGPSSGALASPDEEAAAGESSRGSQLLARLRAAQGGGSPTTQQRNAYRNIVVQEIGETAATSLVRGVWRVTPERLGPEQMDELLSWGKQDTFSDETKLVLAELRAERERAESATSENGSARPAPRPRARPLPARDPSGGA